MKRIPEFDGFRAIAVTMVMAVHTVGGWPAPPQAPSWMRGIIRQAVNHGWLGVDLFFVLSGFLITGILLDEDRKNYFGRFYMRRATRILPLAVVYIAVCALAYGHPYGPYFLLALIFCANLAIPLNVAVPHGPTVLWSLAVEEHFYLVWPVVALVLKRSALVVVAAAIVLAEPALRYWGVSHGMRADRAVYQLSWYRFDGLALGALLALWVRGPYFTRRNVWLVVVGWMIVIGVATIALMPSVLEGRTPAASALRSTQAQAVFFAAMALTLAYPGSRIAAPLRSSIARLIATLSYCLYLVHAPIGDLYRWMLGQAKLNDAALGPAGTLAMRALVIFTVSFAVAALSQRFLEGPFMRLRRASSVSVTPALEGRATASLCKKSS
jgi:peptidoglycan/LPS O-acetylase OafA/YrhL